MIQTVSKPARMALGHQVASGAFSLGQRWCTAAVFLFAFLFSANAFSQSYVSEAQQNGFTLKKVVSDTVVATGMNFSYTIYFSFPPGSTGATIIDNLPPGVTFQGLVISSGACTPTSVSTPAVGTNGTVSITWGATPTGCSGSFVITVQFPNGTTCDGTGARNRVCMYGKVGELGAEFCTGYVSTTAKATNPWNIGKWVLNAAWQGGSCPYATADSVVSYQVCVYKNVGTTGQLNLDNAVVRDTLPSGAYLLSSSCGATQTGNVITWTIGNLSALPMYNMQCCTFNIVYPPALFPNGTTIPNQAWVSGILGSQNNPCAQWNQGSNKTCVEIKAITQTTLSKWVYTNGQPGCNGRYLLYFCNTGTTTISSFTIRDTLPTSLTGYSLGSYSGGITPTLAGNIVTVTSTASLAPGQCRYVYINFTIPATATPGSTITNCAWATYPGLTTPLQACRSFTVTTAVAQACVWKEVCNKQSHYKPGDVLRYRLRVQNIGGLAITAGAVITDNLNSNLEYIGNESYYTSTTWNTACQSTSNWFTVTPGGSGNNRTFTLPAIAASCQDFLVGNCGYYGTGGVPYYYIEFDVRVRDTAALGNIPNYFTISGGGLSGTTTSNTEYILVEGTINFALDKSVAPDLSSWSSYITSPSPASANYRLRLNLATGSVSLRNICFVDLLPRDNFASDIFILGPCISRGSTFDVTYNATISTTPGSVSENNPFSFAKVSNFVPAAFTGGCGTAGSWFGGIPVGAKNLGYNFLTPVPGGGFAESIFNVAIPASLKDGELACNTFGANGAVRHLIQSSLIQDIWAGQLESQKACIEIKNPSNDCIKLELGSVVSIGTNAAGDCIYAVEVKITNPNASNVQGWFSSYQGAVTPSPLTVVPGVTTQTFIFTDTPPSDFFACIRYGIIVDGKEKLCDSICFDLPSCEPPHDECCAHFIHEVTHTDIKVDPNGHISFSTFMFAGPVPIKRFSVTIVSAQRRRVCRDVVDPWERIFGDITNGSLSSQPAPGPVLLPEFSREAVWGPGECREWMNGVFLNLDMVFPMPYCKPCYDTLVFALRFSYTDCECRTCDTVIYYTVVRSCPEGSDMLKQASMPLPGLGYEEKGVKRLGSLFANQNSTGVADAMGQANNAAFKNVRTYSVYFSNQNSSKKTVYALKLNPQPGIKVLAVGPANADDEGIVLVPEKNESGGYTVKTTVTNHNGIVADETITSIFITVAGSLNNPDFGFTSLDADNNPISSGKFTLTNAISPVENPESMGALRMTAQPNPTTNSTTLSFSLDRATTNATLGVYNEQGQEVMGVFTNTTLEQGNHVMTKDVSSLASGVYYVILRTPLGTVSQPMTIVR